MSTTVLQRHESNGYILELVKSEHPDLKIQFEMSLFYGQCHLDSYCWARPESVNRELDIFIGMRNRITSGENLLALNREDLF